MPTLIGTSIYPYAFAKGITTGGDRVMYAMHGTTSPTSKILKSVNGGDWTELVSNFSIYSATLYDVYLQYDAARDLLYAVARDYDGTTYNLFFKVFNATTGALVREVLLTPSDTANFAANVFPFLQVSGGTVWILFRRRTTSMGSSIYQLCRRSYNPDTDAVTSLAVVVSPVTGDRGLDECHRTGNYITVAFRGNFAYRIDMLSGDYTSHVKNSNTEILPKNDTDWLVDGDTEFILWGNSILKYLNTSPANLVSFKTIHAFSGSERALSWGLAFNGDKTKIYIGLVRAINDVSVAHSLHFFYYEYDTATEAIAQLFSLPYNNELLFDLGFTYRSRSILYGDLNGERADVGFYFGLSTSPGNQYYLVWEYDPSGVGSALLSLNLISPLTSALDLSLLIEAIPRPHFVIAALQLAHVFEPFLIVPDDIRYELRLGVENVLAVPMFWFTLRRSRADGQLGRSELTVETSQLLYDAIAAYENQPALLSQRVGNNERVINAGQLARVRVNRDSTQLVISGDLALGSRELPIGRKSFVRMTEGVRTVRIAPQSSIITGDVVLVDGAALRVEQVTLFVSPKNQFMEITGG